MNDGLAEMEDTKMSMETGRRGFWGGGMPGMGGRSVGTWTVGSLVHEIGKVAAVLSSSE